MKNLITKWLKKHGKPEIQQQVDKENKILYNSLVRTTILFFANKYNLAEEFETIIGEQGLAPAATCIAAHMFINQYQNEIDNSDPTDKVRTFSNILRNYLTKVTDGNISRF